jgi:thymidylate synthase (FAD)
MAMLANAYDYSERTYQKGIELGIPKEVARLIIPVARYTRMRATANLRNWLGFLQLRDTNHAPGAQWEIRQYADAVGQLIQEAFPRTHALFNGE